MIKTYLMILDELKNYANPKMKLNRLIKEGKYTKIRKGLYETDKNVAGYLLASSLYGPSYLSFDFALSYYGMIPEAVYVITSATFRKNKTKEYHTDFGDFAYRDVPADAFPYGVRIVNEGEYSFHIATKEKALCDKLYTIEPVKNIGEIKNLLIDNLRIEEDTLLNLKLEELEFLSDLYNCTNIKMLIKYLRREKCR